jgi:hypothetical protein
VSSLSGLSRVRRPSGSAIITSEVEMSAIDAVDGSSTGT